MHCNLPPHTLARYSLGITRGALRTTAHECTVVGTTAAPTLVGLQPSRTYVRCMSRRLLGRARARPYVSNCPARALSAQSAEPEGAGPTPTSSQSTLRIIIQKPPASPGPCQALHVCLGPLRAVLSRSGRLRVAFHDGVALHHAGGSSAHRRNNATRAPRTPRTPPFLHRSSSHSIDQGPEDRCAPPATFPRAPACSPCQIPRAPPQDFHWGCTWTPSHHVGILDTFFTTSSNFPQVPSIITDITSPCPRTSVSHDRGCHHATP